MAERTRIVVVVVTYNSSAVIGACLESLAAGLDGLDYEVVVGDNGSDDATSDLVRQHCPGATVVDLGRNAGYAAGINAGIAAARPYDAALVLNPDVRLAPGAVGRLACVLAEPGVGIAVPRILGPSGELELSLRREPTVLRAWGEAVLGGHRAGRFGPLGEVMSDRGAYERPGEADWATGAVMLVSEACLRACGEPSPGTSGPWDESFFLYSEETEFALRARDAGFALRYAPDSVVVHLGGESNTSPDLWRLLTLNRLRLYARRHGRLSTVAFWCALIVNDVLRLRRGPTHRAALAGLLRPWTWTRRPRAASGTGPGYVCFSAQDWWYHNRAHSDIQLMRRVAGTRTVLFVNSLTMRMPRPGRTTQVTRRLARKALSMARHLRQPVSEVPGFWVLTPLMLPFYGSRTARAVSAVMVRWQVRRACRRLGIDRPVIVVTIPTAWPVAAPMDRTALIFNRSDKHSSFREADASYIGELERALLAAADRVLYVSRALMAEEAPLTSGRAEFLDHGVDLDHFRRRVPDQEPEPADMLAIPRPRVGFFGGLDDYLVDFDLLERLAIEIPEAHLVLIGDSSVSMSRFGPLRNVHWLGFRPYETIPMYGAGFDVALMPWLRNDWIAASNPIKLKEYLALGLPVVTIDFPEARRYRDVIHIAEDGAEFVAHVRAVLAAEATSDAAANRRAAVLTSSWDRRAAELVELSESKPGAASPRS